MMKLHIECPKDLYVEINSLNSHGMGKGTAYFDVEIGDFVNLGSTLYYGGWVIQGSEKYVKFKRSLLGTSLGLFSEGTDAHWLWVDTGQGFQKTGIHFCAACKQKTFDNMVFSNPHIKVICIVSSKIRSFKALSYLRNPWALHIGNKQIADISVLGKFSSLTYVDLSHCPVSDISALGSCSLLKNVNLMNCPVSDLSPLYNITDLKEVNVLGTKASPQSIRRLMNGRKAGVVCCSSEQLKG